MSKICVYPWSHININPNGDVWPCCHQRGDNIRVYGNFKNDSIDTIFNSEPAKELRKFMLDGKLPSDCGKCINFEKIGIASPRQNANNQSWAKEILDSIENTTNTDGSLKSYKIKYWDLRWSNLCNMNCVMCDPEWSSLWTQDIKEKLSYYTNKTIEEDNMLRAWKNRINEDTRKVRHLPNKNWIDNNIKDVQSIYFAGGEPLIMKEHWYILNKLVELKRFDVRIKYNTNMLKIDYQKQNAIDLWKHWDRKLLSVEGSIDETGKRAEWIRTGTVWNTVKNNILEVKNAGIRFFPNTSIGCYNVIRLPELLQELFDLFDPDQINVNPVFNEWCCVQVLPDRIKKDILLKTKQWHSKSKLNVTKLNSIYAELEKPHDPWYIKKFFKRCAFNDLNKHSTLFDHIPWFEELNRLNGNHYEKFRDEFIEKSISKSSSCASSNLHSSVHN